MAFSICGVTICSAAGFFSRRGRTALSFCGVFSYTAVAEDDAFVVLVKLNHLEGKHVVELGLSAVLFYEVLGSSEAFHAVLKRDDSALVENFDHGSLMD